MSKQVWIHCPHCGDAMPLCNDATLLQQATAQRDELLTALQAFLKAGEKGWTLDMVVYDGLFAQAREAVANVESKP